MSRVEFYYYFFFHLFIATIAIDLTGVFFFGLAVCRSQQLLYYCSWNRGEKRWLEHLGYYGVFRDLGRYTYTYNILLACIYGVTMRRRRRWWLIGLQWSKARTQERLEHRMIWMQSKVGHQRGGGKRTKGWSYSRRTCFDLRSNRNREETGRQGWDLANSDRATAFRG